MGGVCRLAGCDMGGAANLGVEAEGAADKDHAVGLGCLAGTVQDSGQDGEGRSMLGGPNGLRDALPTDLYGPMAAGASLLLITSKLALRCWAKVEEAGVNSRDVLSAARPAGVAARMMDCMAVAKEQAMCANRLRAQSRHTAAAEKCVRTRREVCERRHK